MPDLSPLRSAGFRHLATALWVNDLGNAIGEVALALLVYDRTGSPLASATLFLVLRFLPALLAPLITSYVEAKSPRVVLTLLYVLEGAAFGGMAVLTHRFSLVLVLVLVAADGIMAIVAAALARSAITNHLMERDLLREGNGLANLGQMVAFAGGPVIAGTLVAWHGAGLALLVDAVSFLLTAGVIACTSTLHIASDREAGTAARFRAGAAAVRGRPGVRRLLAAWGLTVGLSSIAVPIEVVFAQSTLHAGSSGYGLMLTAWGAGMIVGGALFTVAENLPLIAMLALSTALVAIGYGGLAVSPTLAAACAASAVGGVGNGACGVAALTAIQERIPLTAQSAVMSFLYALNQVVPALGFVIGGAVTALWSPRIAYVVSALGSALVMVIYLSRPIDRVRLRKVEAGADTFTAAVETAPMVPTVTPGPAQLQAGLLRASDPKECGLMDRTDQSPPVAIR